MSTQILFTYNYGRKNFETIENMGYDIKLINENEGITYTNDLKDVKILVCYNPFQTLDIRKMSNLKWVQLSSAGIDQLPVDFIRDKNIIVTNNRGGYSVPIGEWIVLKILELLKHSPKFYENQRSKMWKMDASVLELYGKTVGFIGTGSIASEAAKRLKGFGVNILGINTNGRNMEYFDKCFKLDDIDYMLSLSDVVAVTIPYTEKTHKLVNEQRFKSMKQGAYIVNIARGLIIDEKSLISNIESGKIAGAALDVVENEPLDKDSKLWNMSNVIITPHNSWVSEMRNIRRFNLILDNLKRYKNKDNLINVVNLIKKY